jgi:hypothetical protein
MFLFVVRHARWLARFPLLPQIFDALLLAWTCVANRPRLKAMEALEQRLLAMPGVGCRVHRFGGMEFVENGRELGHLHGHGLLDVRVSPDAAEAFVASGAARAHHVFAPRSGWISFQLETAADAAKGMEFLLAASKRIPAKPVSC